MHSRRLKRGRTEAKASTTGSYVDRLEAAGLWSWFDPDVRAGLIQSARQGASPVMGLRAHGWRADGEDLAEGDVGDLLDAVRPALLREGVDLAVETLTGPHDHNSPGYVIRVNGVDIELFRYDPSEPGLPATPDPWMDCTRLPLHRINELLEASGSSRRMAVFFPGGNDGLAVLLPEAAIALLQDLPEIQEAERPIVP